MKAWQGPAILIFNNAKFKESDFDSLMQIRVGGKQGDDTKIGKHGLGFNSCYHFTDVPSFISGDSIVFLDPLPGSHTLSSVIREISAPNEELTLVPSVSCPANVPPVWNSVLRFEIVIFCSV